MNKNIDKNVKLSQFDLPQTFIFHQWKWYTWLGSFCCYLYQTTFTVRTYSYQTSDQTTPK